MKVKGYERTLVEVEVDPIEFVENIRDVWLKSINKLSMGIEYYSIDTQGYWEEWLDTHGSGITTQLREATLEEKELVNAFDCVLNYLRKAQEDDL